MRRSFIVLAAGLLAVGGLVSSASAVWVEGAGGYGYCGTAPWDDGAHYMKRGCNENYLWPWPYVCADRVAVREPFCLMVDNGWRRQNLLGPHHFNSNSSQLTSAGELRVRWILTQAPAERRGIFVERDVAPQVTEQRLATVRQYAAQLLADAETPQISETHLISEGRPASVVDATNSRFQESMPPPVLPALTGNELSTGQ
jgi:hypothetical protein